MSDELLILAMDHRASLLKDVYEIDGEPDAGQVETVSADKALVFDGLLKAIAHGVDKSRVGVLVDERYGADVAARASAADIDLAMPIERSGQELFTLEYGDLDTGEWLDHVDRFDPEQVKVLVRDNPDGDADDRRAQAEHLAIVSAALAEAGRTFLVELVIPASESQLASVGGVALRYDSELRPGLTVEIIEYLQAAGVEPQIWKIEGLETAEDARAVVAVARREGRDYVSCIVLGRDAPQDRLDHWLSVAATVDGFRGFAIGRSVWQQPLTDYRAGRLDRDGFIDAVAANFTHFVSVWDDAS